MPSKRIITLFILLYLTSVLSARGQIRTFKQGESDDSITSLIFSNDGKRLIASSLYDNIVMWDVQTGKKVWQFDFEGEQKNKNDYFVTKIHQLALSPQLSKLALIRDRFRVVSDTLKEQEWQVVLISVENRSEQQIIYRSKELIGSIAFSADNQLLAWSENDKIHLWNVEAQAKMPSIELPRCVLSLAFSPDSKLLAAGLTWASSCKYDPGTEGLIIINPRNGERVKASFGPGPIRHLVFSPNGQFLIAASLDMPGQVRIWNVKSWHPADILKNAWISVQRLSFSADGNYLAAAFGLFNRSRVYVWKLTSDVEPQEFRINEGIWSIDVSPSGETLAVGTEHGRVKLLPIAAANALETGSPVSRTFDCRNANEYRFVVVENPNRKNDSDPVIPKDLNIVVGDEVKSKIELPKESEAKNFSLNSTEKKKAGFEIKIDWGGGLSHYEIQFSFRCKENNFYLYKVTKTSFSTTNPDSGNFLDKKESKVTKIEPNLPIEKFVMTKYL